MMRKIFTVCLLVIASVSVDAQQITVPQTQRPLIVKRTASWCTLCGGWGWTYFRSLLEENQSKAVLWANHYDGIYMNPTTTAIASNLGGVSQPLFFLNNTNQGVSSSNTASSLANIRNQVNSAYATQPIVQSGIRMSIQGDQNLVAQAKARFFQPANGEYYLGIYLVRRSFTGFQANQGNNAEHREVLWGHLTENVFGDLIGNGSIAEGTEVTVNGQIPLNGINPSTLRVVTVIWKKEGTSFRVVNSNESITFTQPTDTDDLLPLGLTAFNIYPDVAQDRFVVSFSLEQSLEVNLDLFSANGGKTETVCRGRLDSGSHTYYIRKDNKPAGVYFLRMSSGRHLKSFKVAFN
jgi:hypothetical protein